MLACVIFLHFLNFNKALPALSQCWICLAIAWKSTYITMLCILGGCEFFAALLASGMPAAMAVAPAAAPSSGNATGAPIKALPANHDVMLARLQSLRLIRQNPGPPHAIPAVTAVIDPNTGASPSALFRQHRADHDSGTPCHVAGVIHKTQYGSA